MKFFMILFFLPVFFSCQTSYKRKEVYLNKPVYDIAVGDSCRIYYSTNSCCFACINKEKLNHAALINDLVIDKGPKDCDGCNAQYAYVFKGMQAGTDTIRLKIIPASESCEDSAAVSKYVIRVHAN